MMDEAHTFRVMLRVRYSECDQQGIVFNARYADYVDLFMGELVRAAFGNYQAFLDEHLDTHVVRYLIEWIAPARYDDVLALTITRLEFSNTSFKTHIEITRFPDKRRIANVEIVNVIVNPHKKTKTPIPATCRERLRAAAAGPTFNYSGDFNYSEAAV
jgi:acyl-CoA thioester hydrolase